MEALKNAVINALKHIVLLSAVILCITSFAQSDTNKQGHFINPEYMIGKIIPASNNSVFPETGYQQVFALSYGFTNNDTTKWGKFYHQPEAGIMLLYSNLGNNDILGHQFGLLPFINFKVFNKLKNPFNLRFAGGASYFTNRFDSIANPTNEVIGAQFTWDVKVFLFKTLYKKNGFNLQMGVGFSHESNGHTRLPNLGINTPMFSLSGKFHNKHEDNYTNFKRTKRGNVSPKSYFFTVRQGIGLHEQDETEGPKMGVLKPVYATSMSGAILFNKHLKLRAGFTYRFYQHFYDHIIDSNVVNLKSNPTQNASNINFFIGNEFLMSHVSIDIELGVNLYRPFYNQFNPGTKIGTTLQKTLSSRIGSNLYLFNTNKLPKHNVFIGAHIKANMAKADYTEFTIGYTYKIASNRKLTPYVN